MSMRSAPICGSASRKVGVRKGYYPAPAGTREDAVVMSRIIEPVAGGADALE